MLGKRLHNVVKTVLNGEAMEPDEKEEQDKILPKKCTLIDDSLVQLLARYRAQVYERFFLVESLQETDTH
jgi:hypothetical protein